MIRYLYKDGVPPCSKEPLKVSLNGRICGEIRAVTGGYQFFSTGEKHGGEIFRSVPAVQKSLMGESL